MTKFAIPLFLIPLCISQVSQAAGDITLHRPVPNIESPTQVVSVSFIGASAVSVQEGGATVYAVSDVQSLVVLESGTVTRTILSTPTTVTYTMAEGASTYSAAATITGIADSHNISEVTTVECSGDGNGGEVHCIQIEAVSGAGVPATTATFTFTGTTVPIFTIKATSTSTPTRNIANSQHPAPIFASFFIGCIYVLARILY
ncbi:hypothetical protein BDZ97DRAFT_1826257 [Flammula alnicola]|nr:hypothetical protein BDZ97DRAFT_1826257 [Flammula alnicola]